MQRVLILCTANSARSQMAEGLLQHMAGDRFEVRSAGASPGSSASGSHCGDEGARYRHLAQPLQEDRRDRLRERPSIM